MSKLCRLYAELPYWESFMETFRGRSYLSKNIQSVAHSAAPIHDLWRHEEFPFCPPQSRGLSTSKMPASNAAAILLLTNFPPRESLEESIGGKYWGWNHYAKIYCVAVEMGNPGGWLRSRAKKMRTVRSRTVQCTLDTWRSCAASLKTFMELPIGTACQSH